MLTCLYRFILVKLADLGIALLKPRATQTRQGAAELHNGHPLDAMIWQDPAQLWNALKTHVRWNMFFFTS